MSVFPQTQQSVIMMIGKKREKEITVDPTEWEEEERDGGKNAIIPW